MKKAAIVFLIFSFSLISVSYADPNRVPGHVGHRHNVIEVTLHSDTVADDGLCSLREAAEAANTNVRTGGKAGECAGGTEGLDVIRIYPPLGRSSLVELFRGERRGDYELAIDEEDGDSFLTISEPVIITGGDIDEDNTGNFATIDIGEASFPFKITKGAFLILKNVKIINMEGDE